jgi:hypothetical protein
MHTILQTLFSPAKAFTTLKEEYKFPAMTLLILLLLMAVNLILLIPVTAKITAITMSSMSLSESQIDSALAVVHKLRYLQVVGGVFTFAVTLFLYAFLLYIIALIVRSALTYTKTFILIVYSYFAVLIGEFINTGLIYIIGLEAITNSSEIAFTGLNLFITKEKAGAGGYTFLTLINPFQLWFILLLSTGLKLFAEIKYTKALLICILFWLITVLLSVGLAMFGELTARNVGVM